MPAGYSGTPLLRKLGLAPGMRCVIIDAPVDYWGLVDADPRRMIVLEDGAADIDFVHLFVRERAGLRERLTSLRGRIAQDGMIWVSWPKRASKVATDLTEDVVRGAGLAAGLVDVKVCALDEVWSGLKLVIRRADRT